MLAELLVGGKSRLTAVFTLDIASSLSSLGMICDGNKLFSPASCNGEIYFDLLHVA